MIMVRGWHGMAPYARWATWGTVGQEAAGRVSAEVRSIERGAWALRKGGERARRSYFRTSRLRTSLRVALATLDSDGSLSRHGGPVLTGCSRQCTGGP